MTEKKGNRIDLQRFFIRKRKKLQTVFMPISNNDISKIDENYLSIKVSPYSIVYTVIDDMDQVILRQEINRISEKTAFSVLNEHFYNQPELNISGENVTVLFENSEYQLIPNEFFREEDALFFFETEFGKLNDETLKFIPLPKWGIHVTFRVPQNLLSLFEEKYPDLELTHQIVRMLRTKIDKIHEGLYVNVRKNAIDVIVEKENRILLANSFDVKTNEDICYFLLNIFEKLNLDNEQFKLCLLFEDAFNRELLDVLKNYFRWVEIM